MGGLQGPAWRTAADERAPYLEHWDSAAIGAESLTELIADYSCFWRCGMGATRASSCCPWAGWPREKICIRRGYISASRSPLEDDLLLFLTTTDSQSTTSPLATSQNGGRHCSAHPGLGIWHYPRSRISLRPWNGECAPWKSIFGALTIATDFPPANSHRLSSRGF